MSSIQFSLLCKLFTLKSTYIWNTFCQANTPAPAQPPTQDQPKAEEKEKEEIDEKQEYEEPLDKEALDNFTNSVVTGWFYM